MFKLLHRTRLLNLLSYFDSSLFSKGINAIVFSKLFIIIELCCINILLFYHNIINNIMLTKNPCQNLVM